jgi:hypothetical protein
MLCIAATVLCSHALPAAPPGQPVAAVLVEVQRYMYIYGATNKEALHGVQQVLDMGLSAGVVYHYVCA